MDVLTKKADINFPKLRRFIHRVTAKEMSALAEPCYYPSLKKYYFEMLHLCKLSEKDISEFIKRFYAGTPAAGWKLNTDPTTNFLIFLMHIFLQNRDIVAYSSTMTYFTIRYYNNIIRRLIRYCNPDVFRTALDSLAKTHLFSREKTIANASYFISKEMQRRHTNPIKAADVKGVISFTQECRTRVAQSVRSFAEAYYRISAAGTAIKTPYEVGEEDIYQFQSLEKRSRAVDQVVKKITIYREIDKESLIFARKLTKIRASLATLIANSLANTKYADDVRMVLELFVKNLKSVKALCGKDYNTYVRKLMGIKRTTQKIYFKQEVQVLLIKILKDIRYREKYEKLTRQSQFLISSFLAYYITSVLRRTVC